MVMIKDKEGIERYSLSKRMYDLAMRIRTKILEEDSMALGIIWGDVGCGKSVFAQHLGYAIDPSLDIVRVCFNKEEFIDAVLNSRKQVIIADEGIALFFSRASMTKEGRLMSELMAQIRQKNLCVLVCVPELLSMEWLLIKAANFVAYCWESTEQRGNKQLRLKGNVAIYPQLTGAPYKTRIIHYLKSKRSNPFRKKSRPIPLFTEKGNVIGNGYKAAWYPVGEKAYKKKKEAILDKYSVKQLEPTTPKQHKYDLLRYKVTKIPLKRGELAEMLGVSRRTLTNWENLPLKYPQILEKMGK